jgi:hypothetical protein
LTTVYRSTALLLLIAGSLMSQVPINTVPLWDGVSFFSSFGAGLHVNTATYGQTIHIAPGSAAVSSFGFEVGFCTGTVTFRGEIYAWDGAKATGPNLFESPATIATASESFSLVLFSTPGLVLPPGNYVLFATTSRDQAGATAAGCRFGNFATDEAYPGDTSYPGGISVYLDNGGVTSRWTSGAWNSYPWNAVFQVNMAPVPPPTPVAGVPAASPATLLLGLAGVIALGLLGLSRLRVAR